MTDVLKNKGHFPLPTLAMGCYNTRKYTDMYI